LKVTPMIGNEVKVESGQYGRLIIARLKPNQDLVESVEQLCICHGIKHAVVRGVVGSIIDATFTSSEPNKEEGRKISGPGIEVLYVYGEVDATIPDSPRTNVTGVVGDRAGNMFAGRFKRGANLSFITVEVSMQEWVPA
jgi:Predicted DNA-binding protein with PD1-like DNA-binding motif